MATLIAMSVNGINGDCGTLGDIDIHTAARHGTLVTVERLSQLIGGGEDVRRLRRGPVESTPAHDAAAAGNIATLTWLLADARSQPFPVYVFSLLICFCLIREMWKVGEPFTFLY